MALVMAGLYLAGVAMGLYTAGAFRGLLGERGVEWLTVAMMVLAGVCLVIGG